MRSIQLRPALLGAVMLVVMSAVAVPAWAIISSTLVTTSSLEPRGYYVLQSAATDALVSESLLRHPYLSGIVLRRRWSDLNPAPGVYNWQYLDREIMRARLMGKKVQLIVFGGVTAPSWLVDAGAQTFQFRDERKGTDLFTMPVPWDPVMLQHYETFVRALGARYNSDATVVAVHAGGPTRFSQEFHLPKEVTALPDWSSDKLIAAWERSIRCHATAFPYKTIILDVSQATSSTDGVANAVSAKAIDILGTRACLLHCALSARTTMGFETHRLLADYARIGVRVGFEMLSGSNEPRFGGLFSDSLTIGRNAGGRFFNVYPVDVPQLTKPF